MSKRKTAGELIAAGLETYKQKAEIYGDSYIRHGAVMQAMFPNGITIDNANDFARFIILNHKISKLCRYTKDFHNPHQDSIHDDGVYSFILEELDQDEEIPF